MYTIQIKPIAIQMAKDAYDWYEEQKVGLGDLFLAELSRCYSKLEKNPLFYQKLKKNYRHLVLNKFPYVLIFEVNENEIIIFAVFHTAKNPKLKFKGK
ncbi:type II toxin-antitoxin system RelE/ParE family toxin [Pedobacter psychrodurus]|uniref:Type II toxin-antitoxin system RelE/ParE family toxin n=1 Tax=Pedobacter psychrodurus TaxID=2530456 RepID=A0A4R0Q1J2_9SPHI|nr:type II toxin-antitoxin system RelE/ParE family toxin [Pedobacter psychrodurus]TCD29738.1 type II toxin-antitoxin system RelE/ParE family toxin [Pedobacter psychrodurus]